MKTTTDDEEDTLIVKVFYSQNEDHSEQVRKIALPQNHLANFDIFLQRVCGICHFDPEADQVCLQYQDQDGDIVSIESTTELTNALVDQGSSPYKFLVKTKQKSSIVVDHEAQCISCHGTIRGFRYKCLSCANYDICQRCEFKGTHPGHDMIRISSSKTTYPPHFFSRLQRFYDKLLHPNHGLKCQQTWKDVLANLDLEDLESFSNNSQVVTSSAEIQDVEAVADTAEDDSTLPSIEELTKNVQHLIEQDNNVADELDKPKTPTVQDDQKGLDKTQIPRVQEDQRGLDEPKTPTVQEDHQSVSEKVTVDVGEESKKISSVQDEKCRSNGGCGTALSRLQDEIDKLLAPLTPSAILTPKDHKEEMTEEPEDVELEDEVDKLSCASSSVSSSPFELCEIICTETEAIVEALPDDSNTTQVALSKDQEDPKQPENTVQNQPQEDIKENDVDEPLPTVTAKNVPPEIKRKFQIGKRIPVDEEDESIQVISTEILRPASVENGESAGPRSRLGTPVPPEEAEALIKIVEEHDKLDKAKEKSSDPVDNYMLASSRLMLRKQLRQQTIDKSMVQDFTSYPSMTRSRSMNYNSDVYDYRSPYAPSVPSTSFMTSSYTMGESRGYSSRPSSTYYSSNNLDRDSKISEAIGQMVSMGYTDDGGWLTQLCTMKRGNIEQILDVLSPVKK